MNFVISGANGRMGRGLSKKRGNNKVACGISRKKIETDFPVYSNFEEMEARLDVDKDVDLIIDFTVADNASYVISYAQKSKKPLIIGTTALSKSDEDALKDLSKNVPVLYSHNTALGVNVFLAILENAAYLLREDFDVEIIEKHDRDKLDSPSGTTGMVLNAIEKGSGKSRKVINGRKGRSPRTEDEIAVHSIRGGNLASEHYVNFIGIDQTIEINHIASSFDIYAEGAVKAGEILLKMPVGLYGMKDIIEKM